MSSATREVIQEWADGEGGQYTFERGRMEAAVREICFEKRVTLQAEHGGSSDLSSKDGKGDEAAPPIKLNKQDVDFVTKELAVPRAEAERALTSCKGDMTEALVQLMTPTKSAASTR